MKRIPVVSENEQLGTFCPNTILDESISERSEIYLMSSEYLLDKIIQREHGNVIKTVSCGDFQLEVQQSFPIPRACFPDII
jgi:hypothetical protein